VGLSALDSGRELKRYYCQASTPRVVVLDAEEGVRAQKAACFRRLVILVASWMTSVVNRAKPPPTKRATASTTHYQAPEFLIASACFAIDGLCFSASSTSVGSRWYYLWNCGGW
jgi:hypothetical protein